MTIITRIDTVASMSIILIMLPMGFEPMFQAREARILDRTRLWEPNKLYNLSNKNSLKYLGYQESRFSSRFYPFYLLMHLLYQHFHHHKK